MRRVEFDGVALLVGTDGAELAARAAAFAGERRRVAVFVVETDQAGAGPAVEELGRELRADRQR